MSPADYCTVRWLHPQMTTHMISSLDDCRLHRQTLHCEIMIAAVTSHQWHRPLLRNLVELWQNCNVCYGEAIWKLV